MGLVAQGLFNGIFRRNYVFLTAVFASAFMFEIAFDQGTAAVWNRLNRGRQWADIKHRYMTQPEAEDDDDE